MRFRSSSEKVVTAPERREAATFLAADQGVTRHTGVLRCATVARGLLPARNGSGCA